METGMSKIDIVLCVASFAGLGYFSYRLYMEVSAWLWPEVPPQQGKARSGGPAKRPPKSREQLLKPIERQPGVREMHLEELAEANQLNGSLLLGCKGRVFDVSSNEMYARDGSYHLFVGKDASVALAKMKFNKEFLDPSQLHWARDLNEEELNVLEDWLVRFVGKYKLVAYIKDDQKLKK